MVSSKISALYYYMTDQINTIAIVGPTCTGKTDLSIKLAQRFNGEIVALDSRTIYQRMDIGTAKPTSKQQKTIKHHAINILEPNRFFTVAEYVKIATAAINDILSRGKLPILCGGTGLYARALLEGIQIPAIAPHPELREELNKLADSQGNRALHNKLAELDPVSASKLSLNDRRRIIRALEVSMVSKQAFSQLAKKGNPPYQTTWIGLTWQERALHKELITKRLNEQLAGGLLEEIEALWKNPSYQAIISNSVNYKEFISHLSKNESLEDACKLCIRSNFQLARKQMIWFRARSFVNWLLVDGRSSEEILSSAIKLLPAYLLH